MITKHNPNEQNIDIEKTSMILLSCLKFVTGRASVNGYFYWKKNRGQVSVCGDACGGCISHLRQHLALLFLERGSDGKDRKKARPLDHRLL
jgi:hypothetical protein